MDIDEGGQGQAGAESRSGREREEQEQQRLRGRPPVTASPSPPNGGGDPTHPTSSPIPTSKSLRSSGNPPIRLDCAEHRAQKGAVEVATVGRVTKGGRPCVQPE